MSSAANPPVKLTSLVTNGRRDGQIRQSLAESKVQMAIETAKLAESEEKLAAAKAESNRLCAEWEKLQADEEILQKETDRVREEIIQTDVGPDKVIQFISEWQNLGEMEEKLHADRIQLSQARSDHDRMQNRLVDEVRKSRRNLTKLQWTEEDLAEKLREIDFLHTEYEERPKYNRQVAKEDKSDQNLTGQLSETAENGGSEADLS